MWCSPVDPVRPIVGYRKMWLRIAKLGDLPADITPHVLRHSFASLAADLGYNEPTIAILARPQDAQHHQQVRPFRRCRVAGRSRCRGECHHEADGVGSGATPVAAEVVADIRCASTSTAANAAACRSFCRQIHAPTPSRIELPTC